MNKKINYIEFDKEVNKYFSHKTGVKSDIYCIVASDSQAIYIYTNDIIQYYCIKVLSMDTKEFTKHYSVELVTKYLFERLQPLADKYNIKYEAIMFSEFYKLYGKKFYATTYNPMVGINYINNEHEFIRYAEELN